MPSAELISFPMEDSPDATPSAEALARLLGRVDRRLAAGRDVHVACAMGRSRSAMVVTNYVAALLGVEFREALALVRYAYPDANPNPGFRDRSAELAVEFAAEVSCLEVDRAVIDGWHASPSPAWL